MRLLSALLACIIIVSFSQTAKGQQTEITIVTVPQSLPPATRAPLEAEASQLVSQVQDWNARVRAFNQKCAAVRNDNTALIQECQATQADLVSQRSALLEKAGQFRDKVQFAVRAAIATLDTRIAQTRKALSQLSIRNGRLTADIDEWIALAKESREKAHGEILDVGTMLGLHFLREGYKAAEVLATKDVARWRGFWPSFTGSPLSQAAAEAHARLDAAKTYGMLADYFEKFGTRSDIAAKAGSVAFDPKELEKWGELSVAIMEVFVKHPLAVAVLADVKIGIPTVYGWWAAVSAYSALTDLAALGESQYKEASRLTQLYLSDVNARAALAK